MPLPDDFIEALTLIGRASLRYHAETGRRVVVVGGAAVSFYTQGVILSGDIDMVADIAFADAMRGEGFMLDTTPQRLATATTYLHPDVPRIGFQLVSGALFDGQADRTRLQPVSLGDDAEVTLPPIEDMIADRLGQFAASKDLNQEMRAQAEILFSLASPVDNAYLLRRIREEGGDPTLLGLP
jgi:hypothetical protein